MTVTALVGQAVVNGSIVSVAVANLAHSATHAPGRENESSISSYADSHVDLTNCIVATIFAASGLCLDMSALRGFSSLPAPLLLLLMIMGMMSITVATVSSRPTKSSTVMSEHVHPRVRPSVRYAQGKAYEWSSRTVDNSTSTDCASRSRRVLRHSARQGSRLPRSRSRACSLSNKPRLSAGHTSRPINGASAPQLNVFCIIPTTKG